MFTNSVIKRRRLPAATWSSIWYLLSSFAVIKYMLFVGSAMFNTGDVNGNWGRVVARLAIGADEGAERREENIHVCGALFLVVADSTNLVTDLRVEDLLLDSLV
jgi:hypothetical protein